ncbi:RNA-guided endonuclease InsQ/TnpB family protein [Streptosporangium sp. NPDC002721]|uniref:RNA-guided endonuclease InsQ/TnpB family protein n=1 Tax=Streptosporangium sp. NPDC002721 TaxID=3366188 RepID=UPI0036AE6137
MRGRKRGCHRHAALLFPRIPFPPLPFISPITPGWPVRLRSPKPCSVDALSFRSGHGGLPVLSGGVGRLVGVSRFRLQPSPAQERALLEHCGHARFVWNLAVEQHAHWRPGRGSAPGFAEQCRQLTEARAAFAWLGAGSVIVQQQALKDFAQAMANFFGRTHRKPTWRSRGRGEGFRIVAVTPGDVRRVSRNVGEVKIQKVGWVRFRWSRPVTDGEVLPGHPRCGGALACGVRRDSRADSRTGCGWDRRGGPRRGRVGGTVHG